MKVVVLFLLASFFSDGLSVKNSTLGHYKESKCLCLSQNLWAAENSSTATNLLFPQHKLGNLGFAAKITILNTDQQVPKLKLRRKRDAVGALHIVTNHAAPIHADVNGDTKNNVKLCPKPVEPSKIEPGIVFQVTPPKDTVYKVKSLRKSYPKTTHLDVIRAISRVAALSVIIVSAAVEFYPIVVSVYNSFYEFFFFYFQ